MGCHFLPQGIFLTQGSNPCLLHLMHYRQIVSHCATWEATDSKYFRLLYPTIDAGK